MSEEQYYRFNKDMATKLKDKGGWRPPVKQGWKPPVERPYKGKVESLPSTNIGNMRRPLPAPTQKQIKQGFKDKLKYYDDQEKLAKPPPKPKPPPVRGCVGDCIA